MAACDGKDREAIQVVWNAWDKATGSADGAGAASLLTTGALTYWNAIRQNAMDGRAEDIAKMAPSDQAIIFRVRLAGKRSELKRLDAAGFYAWYIAQVADLSPAGTVKMRSISIGKDSASAEIRSAEDNPFASLLDSGSGHTGLTAEQAPKIMVRFERENGVWRIDDTSLLEANDKTIDRLARTSSLTVRQLIEQKYAQERGELPPATIWQPMK